MNKIYKIIIPILIITMTFLITPKTVLSADMTYKIGDMNGDGVIDSRDTLRMLEHIAASTIPKIEKKHPDWILKDNQLKAGDINEDGVIDSRDTLRELEYIAASTISKIANKHPEWKKNIESKWETKPTTVTATGITINNKNLILEKGKSTKLIATITPANVTNKIVTWTSSNTNIATVDGLGNVVGKSEGIAIITATTSNGKTATCRVEVKNATIVVTNISLNKTTMSLTKGQVTNLVATITPAKATNKAVTWNSSNANIVSVVNGKITAKNVGTAIITATTSNGKKATCRVNVKNVTIAVNSIKLKQIDRTIAVGTSLQLNAIITPTNATNKTITWSSSNNKIAQVTKTGVVKGIKAGKVTITAKTSNNKVATCIIRVNIPAKSISLNQTNLTLDKGGKYKLKVTFNPTDVTDKAIIWNTSNSNIVEIDKNGEIKAISKGTAYITATSKYKNTAQCKVIVEDNKKAEKVIAVMKSWKNMSGSNVHAEVYKYFNSVNPKYKMKWDSGWCSETVSAAFVKAGMIDLIGGVASHVQGGSQAYKENFEKKGILVSKDVTPKPGWVVCYGDGTGHTGLVSEVSGGKIKVLAGGNSGSHGVHEKTVSKSIIRFYGAPKYSS